MRFHSDLALRLDILYRQHHGLQVGLEELHLEVVLVGIGVGARDAQRQLEQRLETTQLDLVALFVHLLFGYVHEVDQKVALIVQKVVLQRAESVDELVLVEQQIEQYFARVHVGVVNYLLVGFVLGGEADLDHGHGVVGYAQWSLICLVDGVEILAGEKNAFGDVLQEFGRVYAVDRVLFLPEFFVKVLLELLFGDLAVFDDHELVIRVVYLTLFLGRKH